MNRQFSVYLDLVRFAAACLVYLYHSNQRWLTTDVLPMSNYGHSSVIVFFVLSGFVIAYVTDSKERDWPSYTASRVARVFSVVVPALVLCLLLDTVGRHIEPAHYKGYPYDQFLVRLMASLLMFNEWWFISITSFSNVPFWSITYEFWYYVLFGLATFMPGRWRLWSVVGLALFLGPKIAMLAPIWASGVLLYRWQALQRLSLGLAWALVLGSSAAIVGLHGVGFFDAVTAGFKDWIGASAHTQLTFSKFFLADYVLTVLVFANFAGMRIVAPTLAPLFDAVRRPVRALADYTFTLYLLHQPLFLAWGTVLALDPGTPLAWLATTGACALSIFVVGWLTENKRGALREWLHGHFLRLEQARRGLPAAQR
ncbi:MAG: acyltransferase [Burkholderiales bacterium]|nr:acyltransferase [Burkholderiales bacterium]